MDLLGESSVRFLSCIAQDEMSGPVFTFGAIIASILGSSLGSSPRVAMVRLGKISINY
jgi:hypothetical protein